MKLEAAPGDPVNAPTTRSGLQRFLEIFCAALWLALDVLRWRHRAPDRLPVRISQTLVSLGTTFVKLGQGLSLRWDLLSPAYRDAFSRLHSDVPPFDSTSAVASVELSFGAPIHELFASFDAAPIAAASVAQIHGARLRDGRDVVVKVTRPGVHEQVHADLALLRRTVRICQWLWPPLKRHQPIRLVDELAAFMRDEIDMRHEAQNMRRMAPVLARCEGLTMPHLIEPWVSRNVIVQERSRGQRLDAAFGTPEAPKLARTLLDGYLLQLFGAGVFHADPHPGNLHVLDDGHLCLHDFGSVGVLDPASRVALGSMIEAIVANDASAALDAAIELGFFDSKVDRRSHEREIHLILAELASRPLSQWSIAEAIWRVARIGSGEEFRLPADLLALMRTLFLLENTLRALDPELDLLATLDGRAADVARAIEASMPSRRPLAVRVARAARKLPDLVADLLRQAELNGGQPAISVHHHGLHTTREAIARTGNRLALALITLGLYVSGALLTLHDSEPQLFGHLPVLAAVAFLAAGALSLRLVVAISRSGHL